MTLLLSRPRPTQTRPVSGTCRWIWPLNNRGTGVLEVNGSQYFVTVYTDLDGQSTGYRLEKSDGTVYDIDASSPDWICDCPDANYRQRECKHAKALRAALTRIGRNGGKGSSRGGPGRAQKGGQRLC